MHRFPGDLSGLMALGRMTRWFLRRMPLWSVNSSLKFQYSRMFNGTSSLRPGHPNRIAFLSVCMTGSSSVVFCSRGKLSLLILTVLKGPWFPTQVRKREHLRHRGQSHSETLWRGGLRQTSVTVVYTPHQDCIVTIWASSVVSALVHVVATCWRSTVKAYDLILQWLYPVLIYTEKTFHSQTLWRDTPSRSAHISVQWWITSWMQRQLVVPSALVLHRGLGLRTGCWTTSFFMSSNALSCCRDQINGALARVRSLKGCATSDSFCRNVAK